jgi:hypothetical protein
MPHPGGNEGEEQHKHETDFRIQETGDDGPVQAHFILCRVCTSRLTYDTYRIFQARVPVWPCLHCNI